MYFVSISLYIYVYTRIRYNKCIYRCWMCNTMYLYKYTHTCTYMYIHLSPNLYTGIFMRHSPKMTWNFSPLEVGNSMNVHSPWGHGTYNTSKFFPKSGSLEPEKLLCFLETKTSNCFGYLGMYTMLPWRIWSLLGWETLPWFAKDSCLGKT